MERLRDKELIKGIVEKIGEYGVNLNFMHACGTHQETLVRYGLDSLFSKVGVSIKSGPGCPVCVTTSREFVQVMALAERGKTVVVFGDCLRVPVSGRSLMNLREDGFDIRVVYSVEDAVNLAREVKKDVVFMAIGFETTAPTVGAVLLKDDLPDNFYVFSCHRFFLPAMAKLLEMGEVRLRGLIEPGHVSAVIGTRPYEQIRERFHIPQVISGFEPLDLALSAYKLVKQNIEGEARVENEYSRVVSPNGNPTALKTINEVFEADDIKWRGFPTIPKSLMKIRKKFSSHDALAQFEDMLSRVEYEPTMKEKSCRCGEVLRGVIQPKDCPLFNKICTLDNPVGACMVSVEGSCRIQLELGQG
ncbi:MAG: hydrogenase formation protein HypD [Nitrososphaeria archaeon]